MSPHEKAKFADGPQVAQWLKQKGIEPYTEPLKKRVKAWEKGGAADVFAIDRILICTRYGLWDLPDEVWLVARRYRDLSRAA